MANPYTGTPLPGYFQYNNAQILWSTAAASGNIGGWISSSNGPVTATFSNQVGEHCVVYIAMSGANPPTTGFLQDVTIYPINIATLVLPSVATSASVNMFGPRVSGTNVANSVGYFAGVAPYLGGILIAPGAANSWVKVIVVGR